MPPLRGHYAEGRIPSMDDHRFYSRISYRTTGASSGSKTDAVPLLRQLLRTLGWGDVQVVSKPVQYIQDGREH
jgi:hypothetical protein